MTSERRGVPANDLVQSWSAGRLWAVQQAPYLATAILTLRSVIGTDTADTAPGWTADTDWRIYVGANELAAASAPEVGSWLIHHVGHLLRGHAGRGLRYSGGHMSRGIGRTPEQRRWNLAADLEIDDDVSPQARVASLPAAPDLGLVTGATAEDYWDALTADGVVGARDCGSAVDGEQRPWEVDGGSLSDTETMLVRHEVARDIAARARMAGDVPGGWRLWSESLLSGGVNWRQELSAAVRRAAASVAGRVDFTYRRPSRRAAALADVVLPALHQPVPEVVIVVDTSASMDDRMLGRAVAEVGAIVDAVGRTQQRPRMLSCDTAASAVVRVRGAADMALYGGGGTDLRVGLAAAGRLVPRPDLVIVLTDGAATWPNAAPPHVKVVVALLDATAPLPPPWARTVHVPVVTA